MRLAIRGMCNALHAGGNWNNGTNCGSRCRNSNNVRSNVNTNYGGRSSIQDRWLTPKLCESTLG